MKKNFTELVFILDRSGSMVGLESDTIGGFNSMLKKQQEVKGDCRITTVLFDNDYEVLHDRLDLEAVLPITNKEYYVRGSTALLDAVGITIEKLINTQKNSKPEYRAEKILFVITTDGMENASRKYSYHTVKSLIEKQQSVYNWEFLFLGANIDAAATARQFGIDEEYAQNFNNDSPGIALNYSVLGETLCDYRGAAHSDKRINKNWKQKIAEDFKKRSLKK